LRIGYVTFWETKKMKKLIALMLVVTGLFISGCAKSEDATTAPPADTTKETTPPADTPAETPPAEDPAK
jgi:hypothetical protein